VITGCIAPSSANAQTCAYSHDDLSFLPGCASGGEGPSCRFGGLPSIHEPGLDPHNNNVPMLHLDTGNPFWGWGLGFLVHWGVDMGLGNINGSVPFGTGAP